MFKRLSNYIRNKGLCFSMRSKSGKVIISICDELDAVRIVTPHSNELIDGLDELLPALSRAYRAAQDASDEKVTEEIHGIRHTLSKVYG